LASVGGAFIKSVNDIRHRFDSRAAHYDNPITAFVGERELRAIRKLVPPHMEVLDYGCGTGRTTLDHLRRGCKVTAYDISPKMLAIAETKAAEMGFEAGFTTDPGRLEGRTWPIVTCIGVMDYYPDPVPLFKTLRAYLEPAGRLVVTFPNALSPSAWMYVAGSRFTVPAMARTPGFVSRSAARAGFRVTSFYYAFPAIPPLGHTLVAGLQLQTK
jgi:2-polyprenyl-3-methyl-5-hydroxy-6-metoxy-1,4-benzoquinol methylase